MVAGALITGFTVLSAFTAVRVYLSEQFPTALRGRGHIFGELVSRLFAEVLAPFLMEPHTSSPTIFFGTILAVVAIGGFIPLLFGRETVGHWRPSPNRFQRLLEPSWFYCHSAGVLPIQMAPACRDVSTRGAKRQCSYRAPKLARYPKLTYAQSPVRRLRWPAR